VTEKKENWRKRMITIPQKNNESSNPTERGGRGRTDGKEAELEKGMMTIAEDSSAKVTMPIRKKES
jgi:hypothetical protein